MNNCIIVIGFNRLQHLRKTIESIIECNTSLPVLVFIDRSNKEDPRNVEVINYVERNKNLFANIIVREKNYGLKENITAAIRYCTQLYDGFIVLEDDIVLDQFAIKYATHNLEKFKDSELIYHINLWAPPNCVFESSYVSGVMHCWGWASWSEKWKIFNDDTERYLNWSDEKISYFDVDDTAQFYSQIKKNHDGLLSTWAVFWGASICHESKKCLNPPRSLVLNIGLDGSGVHTGPVKALKGSRLVNKEFDYENCVYDEFLSRKKIASYYTQTRDIWLFKALKLVLRRLHLYDLAKKIYVALK